MTAKTRTRKTTAKAAAAEVRNGWNRGLVGPSKGGRPVPLPGQCSTELCGAVADDQDETDPRFTGWTRAGVHGSTEPDRLWCSGQCAAYGIALAELRIPTTTMEKEATAADVR